MKTIQQLETELKPLLQQHQKEGDTLPTFLDDTLDTYTIQCMGECEVGSCMNELHIYEASKTLGSGEDRSKNLKKLLEQHGWNPDFIWYEYVYTFSQCPIHKSQC